MTTATNGKWFTTGSPATTLVYPATALPSRTETRCDGAGRSVVEIFMVEGAERWRTTTVCGGDRVTVDPPTGGVPTTSLSDARGQTVALRQYLDAGPAAPTSPPVTPTTTLGASSA